MAVYDKDGNLLVTLYDKDGSSLLEAYDKSGTLIFPDGASVIKVMSYNVLRWEGYNSLKAIQNIAFDYGAEIVGIQEWGTTEAKTIGGQNCIAYLNGFCYDDVYVSSLDVNHKAVASKIPMTDKTEVVYSQNIERRSYTKSYFTVGGNRIAFFNTHTDYQVGSAIKYAQIQELLAAVSNEEYFILTADLNTTCTEKSESEYIRCVQPFIDSGFNVANAPVGDPLIFTYWNGKTVAESTQITPPDNIITSSNIDILNVQTIETKLSANGTYVIDHIPLIATLQIN